MTIARRLAAAAALICALAAAGCGLGAGSGSNSADLLVTRDYGTETLEEESATELPDSETVLRLLERSAEITTRYGGGFVQSIDGLEGSAVEQGRRFDWFFYVNGVESPGGSADTEVSDGDRVWWDYRDWTDAMRVPALVGSFPEPFLHGFEGTRYRTRIDCLGPVAPCEAVKTGLGEAGVDAGVFEAEAAPGFDAEAGPTLRVLVGPWARVGRDRAAALIDDGPSSSGVFARFERGELAGLDARGEVAARLGPAAGLVAAVRYRATPPTWVVTGAGAAGIEAAASLFDGNALARRYAVAGTAGEPVPLPVGK